MSLLKLGVGLLVCIQLFMFGQAQSTADDCQTMFGTCSTGWTINCDPCVGDPSDAQASCTCSCEIPPEVDDSCTPTTTPQTTPTTTPPPIPRFFVADAQGRRIMQINVDNTHNVLYDNGKIPRAVVTDASSEILFWAQLNGEIYSLGWTQSPLVANLVIDVAAALAADVKVKCFGIDVGKEWLLMGVQGHGFYRVSYTGQNFVHVGTVPVNTFSINVDLATSRAYWAVKTKIFWIDYTLTDQTSANVLLIQSGKNLDSVVVDRTVNNRIYWTVEGCAIYWVPVDGPYDSPTLLAEQPGLGECNGMLVDGGDIFFTSSLNDVGGVHQYNIDTDTFTEFSDPDVGDLVGIVQVQVPVQMQLG